MVTDINVVKLQEPEDILPTYKNALESNDSRISLIIEYGSHYNDK